MDWDLSAYFPSFDDPSRVQFETELVLALDEALTRVKQLSPLGETNGVEWERWVLDFENIAARYSHFASYVHALVSADGSNAEYLDAEARLSSMGAGFAKLEAQLNAALGRADEATFERWLEQPALAMAGYRLRQYRASAQRSMATELEELAADLATDGMEAWGRLYDGVMSNLKFTLRVNGESPRELPFSGRRSLMEGEDRAVRRAAFQGGNAALEPWLPTLGRALNHIAGTRLTLNRHRKIGHVLDNSVFDAGITRAMLDAMIAAVERQIEIPRRVLRLKAQLLGLPKVGWYDLGAPLPFAPAPQVSWEEGVRRVSTAFHRQYPALGTFFDAAISNRWVDHTPRAGKRPGAFCTTSDLIGQSRVFMTFGGTLADVSTLAHEMGHAFHSHTLRHTRALAANHPMTLAESASIFAELVLVNGLLAEQGIAPEQRVALLAALVNDAPVFLLDVHTRFKFERAFYDERTRGEVRVERLSELMAQTQREIFGDTLAEDEVDPYFWASKLHFFITGVSFYNYPYIFGYLLSRGIYARFSEEGPGFLRKYEAFLAKSGAEAPAKLARDVLGCELEEPEFWEQSIQSVTGPLAELEALARR
jgi:oligoendopeptidase F